MIKGIIHKEDRHHKPLETLTTKKQKAREKKIYNQQRNIHKAKIRRSRKEKLYNHKTYLHFSRIFYQVQKK